MIWQKEHDFGSFDPTERSKTVQLILRASLANPSLGHYGNIPLWIAVLRESPSDGQIWWSQEGDVDLRSGGDVKSEKVVMIILDIGEESPGD